MANLPASASIRQIEVLIMIYSDPCRGCGQIHSDASLAAALSSANRNSLARSLLSRPAALLFLLCLQLAAMYVVTLLYFTAAGAGPYSVDEQVLGGELNFYQGLVDKVTGDDEE